MKRVAVFRSSLLPVSETFVRDQVRALRNWEPVLVGFREISARLALDDVQHQVLPRGTRVSFALRTLLALPAPRLVAALRELKVSFVHAHFGPDATDIWPSARAAGLPLLVTLHGYDIHTRRDWWEAGNGGVVRRVYPKRLLQMAHDPAVFFIAVSNALRLHAVACGIPATRITVAYNGVDTDRFQPGGLPLRQRRRRILFVGRMVEKKAPLLLVRAFAMLRRQVHDAELVMVGDGPLLAGAKALARTLDVDVSFLGACDREEVLAHLHESRVFCLPSMTAANGDAEGFGLVILEAQACGVPVVTSARGGADEGLIPGKTGDAFAEGNLDQLTTALRKWLLNDDDADTASAEASKFVREQFSIQRRMIELEGIYERLAATREPE